MKAIIVDDEPLARDAIDLLALKVDTLEITGRFSSALAAGEYLQTSSVDLVFLDIEMPGMNGIEFAKKIPKKTLVIFTTAYPEYALEGFEIDAIDYLIKPIKKERFQKAIDKAFIYHNLLEGEAAVAEMPTKGEEYFFVKSERRFIKVEFKEILFIEGLKDYVVLQTSELRIMTAMNIKTIHDKLPQLNFARVGKSFIINVDKISSFDSTTLMIGKYEIPIGNSYRNYFFDYYISKRIIGRDK